MRECQQSTQDGPVLMGNSAVFMGNNAAVMGSKSGITTHSKTPKRSKTPLSLPNTNVRDVGKDEPTAYDPLVRKAPGFRSVRPNAYRRGKGWGFKDKGARHMGEYPTYTLQERGLLFADMPGDGRARYVTMGELMRVSDGERTAAAGAEAVAAECRYPVLFVDGVGAEEKPWLPSHAEILAAIVEREPRYAPSVVWLRFEHGRRAWLRMFQSSRAAGAASKVAGYLASGRFKELEEYRGEFVRNVS